MSKHQEALTKLLLSTNKMSIEEVIEILSELIKIPATYKPIYNINDCEFLCKCGSELKGHENYCSDCGIEIDWSE